MEDEYTHTHTHIHVMSELIVWREIDAFACFIVCPSAAVACHLSAIYIFTALGVGSYHS